MERTVKCYQTIQVGLAAVEIKSKPQRQVQRSPVFKGASLLTALTALCMWVWEPVLAFSEFWKAVINVVVLREDVLGQNCPFTPAVKLKMVLIQSSVSQRNYFVVLSARGIMMFQNQFFNFQTEYRNPRPLPLSHKVRFLCWTAFYLLKVPAWLGSCWEPAATVPHWAPVEIKLVQNISNSRPPCSWHDFFFLIWTKPLLCHLIS